MGYKVSPGAGLVAERLSARVPLQRLGFAGSDPGCGPTHRSSSHAEAVSHIEELQLYNYDTQLCTGALGRKKKGRLAKDVSAGPIFLKK